MTNKVTIGGSVALIVIGAILRFGVTWKPAHVDLQVIGVILMVAGVLGLTLSLVFLAMRRRDRRSAQVYEERRYAEPPRPYAEPPRPYTEPPRPYTEPPGPYTEPPPGRSTEPPA